MEYRRRKMDRYEEEMAKFEARMEERNKRLQTMPKDLALAWDGIDRRKPTWSGTTGFAWGVVTTLAVILIMLMMRG